MGTAAVTAAGEVHGFPAALASFIGRAGALREVAGLLGEYRLVTVTGPGQPAWAALMAKMRRKTLIVCAACHDYIHANPVTRAA